MRQNLPLDVVSRKKADQTILWIFQSIDLLGPLLLVAWTTPNCDGRPSTAVTYDTIFGINWQNKKPWSELIGRYNGIHWQVRKEPHPTILNDIFADPLHTPEYYYLTNLGLSLWNADILSSSRICCFPFDISYRLTNRLVTSVTQQSRRSCTAASTDEQNEDALTRRRTDRTK
jgi:hypothetical protein